MNTRQFELVIEGKGQLASMFITEASSTFSRATLYDHTDQLTHAAKLEAKLAKKGLTQGLNAAKILKAQGKAGDVHVTFNGQYATVRKKSEATGRIIFLGSVQDMNACISGVRELIDLVSRAVGGHGAAAMT